MIHLHSAICKNHNMAAQWWNRNPRHRNDWYLKLLRKLLKRVFPHPTLKEYYFTLFVVMSPCLCCFSLFLKRYLSFWSIFTPLMWFSLFLDTRVSFYSSTEYLRKSVQSLLSLYRCCENFAELPFQKNLQYLPLGLRQLQGGISEYHFVWWV